jgi:hypothetical protein
MMATVIALITHSRSVAAPLASVPSSRHRLDRCPLRDVSVFGRLFHVSYTVEGTWRLLKRHGW